MESAAEEDLEREELFDLTARPAYYRGFARRWREFIPLSHHLGITMEQFLDMTLVERMIVGSELSAWLFRQHPASGEGDDG